MQTHVAELTKKRLSDFFIKEDGQVAHKNALVAGTVAIGAIFASQLLAPDTAEAHWWKPYRCGDDVTWTWCNHDEICVSDQHEDGDWFYDCV